MEGISILELLQSRGINPTLESCPIDYAEWVMDFQQRDKSTISFSNQLSYLNMLGSWQLVNLDTMEFGSKFLTKQDMANLRQLNNFFALLVTMVEQDGHTFDRDRLDKTTITFDAHDKIYSATFSIRDTEAYTTVILVNGPGTYHVKVV